MKSKSVTDLADATADPALERVQDPPAAIVMALDPPVLPIDGALGPPDPPEEGAVGGIAPVQPAQHVINVANNAQHAVEAFHEVRKLY